MKLDNHNHPKKADTEIVDHKQVQKQHKFMGSVRIYKGQTLCEIDALTGNIQEAEYDVDAVDFAQAQKGDIVAKRKVVTKEHHFYIPAINKATALKKLHKRFKQALNG